MNYLDANHLKFRNKLFSFEEVKRVYKKTYEKEIDKVKEINTLNNQYNIAILTATLLNSAPYKMGKKRLTTFFQLFFDQLNYLGENPEDFELVKKTVNDIGLDFEIRKGKLKLHVEE